MQVGRGPTLTVPVKEILLFVGQEGLFSYVILILSNLKQGWAEAQAQITLLS